MTLSDTSGSDTSGAAIVVRDLYKRYRAGAKGRGQAAIPKEHVALKSVDLDIPRGKIFGLLGPNGAGKSTFINILAGLVVKTGGQVIVEGVDQDHDPRATRKMLGIVPQEVILDPFFNVRETLEYYAGYYGIAKKDRWTDELLEALSLSDKAHVNSRRLSGGMKRRVLIAKALVHKPPILILDEPTAGVDVELREQLWTYVRKLNEEGTTIVLTTHYLEEAEALCDDIAIINHGDIVAQDSTKALMQRLEGKHVVLQFVEPLERIPEALAAYAPKQTDAHTLEISYNRAQHSMQEVLEDVRVTGLALADLSTCEPDLEDVFRHLLTASSAQAQAA